MLKPILRGAGYSALQDLGTGRTIIEFLDARSLTILRFELLEAEAHRHSENEYIESLIQAYHRNPSKFGQNRKTSAG